MESRISETLVFPAPAVARCGRDVVVTRDRAERPVHAHTFSGAPLMGFRTPNDRACAGDEKVICILLRKLARNSIESIELQLIPVDLSARATGAHPFNSRRHVVTQS
jgi:hypothetical protein